MIFIYYLIQFLFIFKLYFFFQFYTNKSFIKEFFLNFLLRYQEIMTFIIESSIWYLVKHPNEFDNKQLEKLSTIPSHFPRIFRELVQLTIPEPRPINVPEANLSQDLISLLEVNDEIQ